MALTRGIGRELRKPGGRTPVMTAVNRSQHLLMEADRARHRQSASTHDAARAPPWRPARAPEGCNPQSSCGSGAIACTMRLTRQATLRLPLLGGRAAASMCSTAARRRIFPSFDDDIATVIHIRRDGDIGAQPLGQTCRAYSSAGCRLVTARPRHRAREHLPPAVRARGRRHCLHAEMTSRRRPISRHQPRCSRRLLCRPAAEDRLSDARGHPAPMPSHDLEGPRIDVEGGGRGRARRPTRLRISPR